jgi:hypothetical protein
MSGNMRKNIYEFSLEKMKAEMTEILTEKNLFIERKSFDLSKILGKGNFGCVYEAVWRKGNEKVIVAVKKLKNGNNDYLS